MVWDSARIKILAVLLTLLLISVIIVLALLRPTLIYEPPFLITALNLLFLTILPFSVAYLAMRSYTASGVPSILLLGAGLIAFGCGSLVAGFTIYLPGGTNLTPTIHNSGALIGSLLITLSAIFAGFKIVPAKAPARAKLYVGVVYAGTFAAMAALSIMAIAGLVPTFFVQGVGPTMLRQVVLGTAVVLFTVSSIIYLHLYQTVRTYYVFWCGMGFILIAVGLAAVFLQTGVGSLIGWAGRAAQYLGCLYLFIGKETVFIIAGEKHITVADEITNLHRTEANYEALVEIATEAIISIDEKGYILTWNAAAERIFGHHKNEAIGRRFPSVIGRCPLTDYLDAKINRGNHPGTTPTEIISGEFPARRKSGELFQAEISAAGSKHSGSWVFTLFIKDITEHKRGEEALKESEEKYRVLFNNEIYAILIFDLETLKLLDVNDTYCRMYGYSREELLSGMTIHDITAEHQVSDAATRQAINEGTIFIPLRYHRKKDGTVFTVEIVGGPYVWQGRKVMFALIHNITDRISSETERKQVEEQKSLSLKILELLTKTGGQSEIISKILLLIKDFSGCEAVGIRLKAVDDYPYYEANGFMPGHVELENSLCTCGESGEIVRDSQGNPLLECMCGNIIRSRFDPTLSFFTPGGSFWSNCTTELLASTTDEDRQAHTRNKCNGEGYESVALIPLKGEGGNIGLLQLNDTRRNRFTPDMITFYESIASSIGIIIGRKEAEEMLRESEEKHRAVIEMASDVIIIIQDGIIRYANPRVATMLGYEIWEIEGMNFASFISQEYLGLALERYQKRMAGEKLSEIFETALLHKSGRKIPVETSGSVIQYEGKQADLAIIRDITERKQVEETLREERWRLQSIIEGTHVGTWEWNVQTGETVFNETWAQITGYTLDELSPISIKTWEALVHPDDLKQSDELLERHFSGELPYYDCECRMKHKDGNWVWVHDRGRIVTSTPDGKPLMMFGTHSDITERKRLEAEQQRVEKLESIGTLAGGIAHNFNNILTMILGNISLASMEAQDGSELQKSLEQAEKASLRAKDLTLQLLTFSKGGGPVKEIASLTELLRDTANSALTGSNVKCRFSIPDGLWQAEIDARQVSQVIYNLVINARQSMPKGGTIELSAENMALNKTQGPGKAGDYIRVAVTDHGSGIPKEHLEKIFDPFFTTKINAHGLGVPTAFSIARQHGGHLSVESVVGSGSTFYLYLPASAPKQDKKKAIKAAGKARILVMDDEQGVRAIAGRMLKHIGYEDVEFAEDGAEAIKLYKASMKSGNSFTVAILDLTIAGGMGGEIAIQNLLKIDPGVKAIVSSGYIDDPVMTDYREYGFSGMLVKPYTIAELRKAVQDIIG